ncbi:substrate-binding domain-containing protein [Neptunomonas antarctica]|uniref:Tungstate transport system substrate-binding protein n=1 Tax=Neptunomonas antarctica TaxID=619304 RepID=A0A1N7ND82_9GAMM|nr:substrate-binding domain-containing protein [Neptunomonas antarctica]SIS96250.1 tungstate transport system substrate-binding protein [Neptunomonas antarctica]
MKKWISCLSSMVLLFCLSFTISAAENIIRLATTTSTYNSGLLDELLPVFEKKYGVKVHVISVGTGKALRMGRDGDVDLLVTHAPAAEKEFVDQGHGVEAKSVMYNDFVVVGPANDPAGIKGSSDVVSALRAIADSQSVFISRGDDSGTHKKELALLKSAGVAVGFEGYKEIGQGMGKVLQVSDELQGYTLTDRGTWLAYQKRLQLTLLVAGDPRLFNPYQVILVNPARYEGLNTEDARSLAQWLVSVEGQSMINGFRINGEVLFHGSAQPVVTTQ